MELPRLLTPDVLWTGGCVELGVRGERVHSHFSNFVIRGNKRSILVDTGHPMHAQQIERAYDAFLGDTPSRLHLHDAPGISPLRPPAEMVAKIPSSPSDR